MGGGGFISGMNSSSKENNRVRNKRSSIYDTGRENPPTSNGEPLEFNKMNDEERIRFQDQLHKKVLKKRRIELLAYGIAITLICSFLIYLLA